MHWFCPVGGCRGFNGPVPPPLWISVYVIVAGNDNVLRQVCQVIVVCHTSADGACLHCHPLARRGPDGGSLSLVSADASSVPFAPAARKICSRAGGPQQSPQLSPPSGDAESGIGIRKTIRPRLVFGTPDAQIPPYCEQILANMFLT